MSWRGVLLAIVAVAVVAAVAVTSYVARWQQQPLSVDGRELIGGRDIDRV